MKKVKLSLNYKGLDNSGLVVFSKTVETCITGNVNFPNCAYTASLLGAAYTDLDAAIVAKDSSINLQSKRMQVEKVLYALKGQVELECKNDEALAATSGFPLQASTTHKAKTFSVKQGPLSGTAELHCVFTKGCAYVWEMVSDPINTGVWAQCDITTVSALTVNGLTPGNKYWFRVKPVKTGNEYPYSDPYMLHVI